MPNVIQTMRIISASIAVVGGANFSFHLILLTLISIVFLASQINIYHQFNYNNIKILYYDIKRHDNDVTTHFHVNMHQTNVSSTYNRK